MSISSRLRFIPPKKNVHPSSHEAFALENDTVALLEPANCDQRRGGNLGHDHGDVGSVERASDQKSAVAVFSGVGRTRRQVFHNHHPADGRNTGASLNRRYGALFLHLVYPSVSACAAVRATSKLIVFALQY
jgi:hypothetical protein